MEKILQMTKNAVASVKADQETKAHQASAFERSKFIQENYRNFYSFAQKEVVDDLMGDGMLHKKSFDESVLFNFGYFDGEERQEGETDDQLLSRLSLSEKLRHLRHYLSYITIIYAPNETGYKESPVATRFLAAHLRPQHACCG